MKKTRILALATTVLMSTTILSGCGKSGGSNTGGGAGVEVSKGDSMPIAEPGKIKFSAIGSNPTTNDWNKLPAWQEFAKVTGIEIEWDTPPSSDFNTKLNLALNTGEYPDIIYGATTGGLSPSSEQDFGKQGILIPLEDLIDGGYAPNIKRILDENPEMRASITNSEGHIYSLPAINKTALGIWHRGPVYYNGLMLEALNAKVPTTIDEFYELAKRVKTEDPNGNGIADEYMISEDPDGMNYHLSAWLIGAFGLKTQGIEVQGPIENGKVRDTRIDEQYKAYLEFMNKMYSEGMIDPEVYSQSGDQKGVKLKENRVMFYQAWSGSGALGLNDDADVSRFPMMTPMTSSVNSTPVQAASPRIARNVLQITDKCKNPEAAIRWADFMYTDEGSDILARGPEGTFWIWDKDDDGNDVRVENKAAFGEKNAEDFRGTVVANYGNNPPGYSYDKAVNPTTKDEFWTFPILREPNQGYEIGAWDDFMMKETEEKIIPYASVPFPVVYLLPEETEKIVDI